MFPDLIRQFVRLQSVPTGKDYKVIGLRRGWAGITEIIRDPKADNSNNFQILTDDIVNKAGRTGGTFLHTSRTRPSHMSKGNSA